MLKNWLSAFRLRTLPLAVAGILMGLALAWPEWDSSIAILAIATAVLLQILSNLANDLGDYLKGTDNKNRLGPRRALQSSKISLRQMQWAVLTFSILSLLSGLLLLYNAFNGKLSELFLLFLLLGIGSIAAAINYTMGKRAYGYHTMGDIFVFLFFGLLAVLGSYYLIVQQISITLVLPAASIGMLSASVLNLNNMRDIENDEQMNKNTLAVKLGLNKAKMYQFTILVLPFVFLVCYNLIIEAKISAYLFLLISPLFLINGTKMLQFKKASQFDGQLKMNAIGTFLLSILFLIGTVI